MSATNFPTGTDLMLVFGIDPGLTTTGYGLIRRSGRLEAVAAGAIRTDPAHPIGQRLLEIHRGLHEVIAQHSPEIVAIEQVFTNRNLQTAVAVGRAAGVAILVAAEHDLPVFEYAPTMVKSAVTGDGAADKKMMARMIGLRLGIAPPAPPDAADGLAVAMCHLQTLIPLAAQ